MRTVFVAVSFLSILWTIASYFISPERVAIHFDAAGTPDNFTSSMNMMIIWLVVNGLVIASFYFTAVFMRKAPVSMINLPNKEYWLNNDNIAGTRSKIESQLFLFGTATLVLLNALSVLATMANQSPQASIDMSIFVLFLLAYMVFTIYWLIKLVTAFKVPVSGKD